MASNTYAKRGCLESPSLVIHDQEQRRNMKFSFYYPFLLVQLGDVADGFAALNGGTTGGSGGTLVTVSNQADLERYAKASGKYVVKVSGRINLSPKGLEVDVANDKTIIGIGANAEISGGGFRVINRRNVIIRNLRIGMCTFFRNIIIEGLLPKND